MNFNQQVTEGGKVSHNCNPPNPTAHLDLPHIILGYCLGNAALKLCLKHLDYFTDFNLGHFKGTVDPKQNAQIQKKK